MNKSLLLTLLLLLSGCVSRPQSYETAAELLVIKDMKIIPEAPNLDAKNLEAQVKEDIKTPIQFYVRVVDENNQPIVGLPVEIANLNRVLQPFNYPYFGWEVIPNISTDKKGEIALETQGAALFINVETEQYWREGGLTGLVYYAPRLMDRNVFQPPVDKNKPAVVKLKFKPEEAYTQAISTGAILLQHGEVSTISLRGAQRYTSLNHDLEIVLNKPERTGDTPYTWSFSVSVPGGGIQRVVDLPNVRAPTQGYRRNFSFEMPENANDWDHRKTFFFYIKTQDNLYALVELRIRTSQQAFVALEGAYNPHGSEIVR